MLTLLADRPIDPLLHRILVQAQKATEALHVDFFVGGAMARDILLTHVYGQAVRRATSDVDLGIHLQDWERFNLLKRHLIGTGKFFAVENKTHRLNFGRLGGTPLDLIPFGGVEDGAGSISWPPGHDVVLNVSGFAEAHASAQWVDLGGGLKAPICSLAALAVLKLIAWIDRRHSTNKDASDFIFIAQHYFEAGNLDRLYEQEIAILEAVAYRVEVAGAMLLGKDAALQSAPRTVRQMAAFLASGPLRQQLIDQQLRAMGATADAAKEIGLLQVLDAFDQGFSGALGCF